MMQKVTVMLAALLCSVLVSQAQLTVKPSMGVNFSDFSKEANGSTKSKLGYQAGVGLMYGSRYYIESGLFYNVKSTEFTSSTGTSKVNAQALIKGIRVPLTIGAHLIGDNESLLGVRAFGGGSAYYVTSTGKDVKVGDITRMSWGAHAGVGVDVWMFFGEASYEWSMTNVQKNVGLVDFGKHRSIYITAGLRMNL